MSVDTVSPSVALTVADVARASGVAPSAVRFYERHGLVSADRTPGNQRRFGKDAACRIRVARVAQRIGLSIAEIRELLASLPAEAAPEDWQRLHDELTLEGQRRIAELNDALAEITSGRKLCDL
jgi:MerR family transcriptional regulator, redox-sensitive transcriptional activator SoxR